MHRLGRLRHELSGDSAPIGVAGNVGAAPGNVTNQGKSVGCLFGDAEWAWDGRASEKAAAVVVRDLVAAGEGGLGRKRRRRVANDDPVDQDEGFASPDGFVLELAAVDW